MTSPLPIASPQNTSLGSPGSPSLPYPYSYIHDEDIKASFLRFSANVKGLDKGLGTFANICSSLGRVAGLLLAVKKAREMIGRTREVFFSNATALAPELYDLARKDCNTAALTSDSGDSEHFYIPHKYFENPQLFFDLPVILEELAQAFGTLHARVAEFRDFTDEGLMLKSLLLTLENDLMYRASCVRVYSNRLNTRPIQRYVHQFTDELQNEFERLASALLEFTSVGVSAIGQEQQRSTQSLSNILTVATFFSGVTAGTLGMSVGSSVPNPTLKVSSMLWFGSLAFSVGAALNSLLAMAWKETKSGSRGKKLPFWVTMWIDGSQLLFLGIAIVMFSAGLVVFAFASEQAVYTPYVTVAATVITFTGLTAILIWMIYEICVFPVLIQPAHVMKSSRDSIHSDVSKYHLSGDGIAGTFSNALSSLRALPYRGDEQSDVESLDDKTLPVVDDTLKEKNIGRLKTVFRDGVREQSIMRRAARVFDLAGHKHRRRHTDILPRREVSEFAPRSTQTTRLNLPLDHSETFDFTRHGIIKDVAYSLRGGYWLAVTCVKRITLESWTVVINAQTLQAEADVWHIGRVISERLIWSPFGNKLIVKFDHRYDIWDLDVKKIQSVERHHEVQDVAWCDENTVLVAEHNCVFRMNGTRPVTVYHFDGMHVRSIALEMKHHYLIVIARVAKSPDQIEPAISRSEKRIIIYDMEKLTEIYQIPVLEDIFRVQPIAGELDILVTHKYQKEFQLWTLDAGLKGAEISAVLKKRTITPHTTPTDYIGPIRIIGNYDHFIMSGTSSGALDIWRRDTGTYHERFEPKCFLEEGISCFSWRRATDDTATFATSGVDSSILRVWRGEELIVTTPTSPELAQTFDSAPQRGEESIVTRTPTSPEPALTPNSGVRNPWQNAIALTIASSKPSAPPS